jgi:hypothetical protein
VGDLAVELLEADIKNLSPKTQLFMKKLFVFLFLFSVLEGLAQCPPTNVSVTKPPPPVGKMNQTDVQNRINIFMTKKGKMNLNNLVSYDPCGFLQMLQKVIDVNQGYSGLRVYFGVDPSFPDSLILIFSPTHETTTDQVNYDETDDITSYMTIVNKTIQPISIDVAKTYVKAFNDNQKTYFNNDGKNHYANENPSNDNDYEETSCLWYDIKTFQDKINSANGTSGMTQYLKYLIKNSPMQSVNIDFAGFEHTTTWPRDFDYQLTILFDFVSKQGKDNYFSASSFKLSTIRYYSNKIVNEKKGKQFLQKNITSLKKLLFSDDTIDTGVPCPPPPIPNNPCPGALLLQ